MPDVIAVLLVALEHAELGPMTITYETGQGGPDVGVATRDGVGGPLDGDDLRTARCAALREYRQFADGPALGWSSAWRLRRCAT